MRHPGDIDLQIGERDEENSSDDIFGDDEDQNAGAEAPVEQNLEQVAPPVEENGEEEENSLDFSEEDENGDSLGPNPVMGQQLRPDTAINRRP